MMVKFLLDRMLGQTAKWLRLMGIDAEYPEEDIPDEELLEKAREDDRVLVTRDKELGDKEGAFLVSKRPPQELIKIILENYEVDIDPMTRCSKCNSKVEEIEKDEVEGEVPDGIFERKEKFWRCKGCGQIYWKGSHWLEILKTIDEIKGE